MVPGSKRCLCLGRRADQGVDAKCLSAATSSPTNQISDNNKALQFHSLCLNTSANGVSIRSSYPRRTLHNVFQTGSRPSSLPRSRPEIKFLSSSLLFNFGKRRKKKWWSSIKTSCKASIISRGFHFSLLESWMTEVVLFWGFKKHDEPTKYKSTNRRRVFTRFTYQN